MATRTSALAFKGDVEYRSHRYITIKPHQSQTNSPLPSTRSIISAFKELRLSSARSIFCNSGYTFSHEHQELADAYAMQRLLIWLGSKYGLAELLSPIPSSSNEPERIVESFFLSTNIYPFTTGDVPECISASMISANSALDASFSPSVQLIGSLFEHLTSFEINCAGDMNGTGHLHIRSGTTLKYLRRNKGQFYTPAWVVDYCLEKSLKQDLADFMKQLQGRKDITLHPFSILDPACGTGNFLIGVLRMLKNAGAGAVELLNACKSSLHGRDVDGRAVALSIFSVLLQFCSSRQEMPRGSADDTAFDVYDLLASLKKNIKLSDAVYDSFLFDQPEGGGERHGFDLIITNPPYISFGSRNQERILPSVARFLKARFAMSSEYKIRLNSVFQEVALKYARPGGKICLLVPNSFLTGRRYNNLRAGLLKRTRILSLSELPEDTIDGAVVGRWCVAVYQTGESADLEYAVDLTDCCYGLENCREYKINASHLVSSPGHRFRLVFNDLDKRLALALEELPPLRMVLRGHTGIRARTGQKSIIAPHQLSQAYKAGITSGSQVRPFSVIWAGAWLQIESNLLFAGGFDARVVENPKIMVRQTGDRIIAAFDDSRLYHLNNVHSFSPQLASSSGRSLALQTPVDAKETGLMPPRSISPEELHYLVSLMNSNLWLYIYQIRTREDGRALAQIDIETVEAMPIAHWQSAYVAKLAALAEYAAQLMRQRQTTDVSDSSDVNRSVPIYASMEARMQGIIDRLVYTAYGLAESEIKHIEECLAGKSHLRSREIDLPPLPQALEEAEALLKGTSPGAGTRSS